MIENLESLQRPQAHCTSCNRLCSAHHESVDWLVAGFLCTPYTSVSTNRYKPDCYPLTHPEFAPFPMVSQYLNNLDPGPLVTLLENVEGLVKPVGGGKAPIEFIEHGVLEWQGEVTPIGMKHLSHTYKVSLTSK